MRCPAFIGIASVGSHISFALASVLLTAPLVAQTTGVVAGHVTQADTKEGLPGVTLLVAGTQLGAITRSDGAYRIALRPGTYEIRARVLGYNVKRDTVTVVAGQTATRDFALERSATQLQAVAVTGTRAEERTVVNSPVPVDVLSAADLKTTGRTETAQMLQMLAPSVNFPRPTVTDGTDHVRPATLRGLGPDQMLVLINGKRRYNSALVNVNGSIGRGSTGVDLNAIPASMIERIEVLRDGAAAQYGSDAIAGVINIILKTTGPNEFTITGGQTAKGDGDVGHGSIVTNTQFGADGYFEFDVEYRDRAATNRTQPDPRPQYFAGDPRETTINRLNHRQGDAATKDAIGFYNTAFTLASGVQVYSFGGVSRREGDAAGFWRRPNDDRTVRALHPDGFLPLIDSEIWDGSGSVGIKGNTSGWRWDLGTVYGRNSFRFDVLNSNNVSLGNASPINFYAGTLKFDQSTSNADVFREFRMANGTPVRVALGGEFRYDRYQIEPGDKDSYRDGGVKVLDQNGNPTTRIAAVGAQVFPGFQPADATDQSRSNYAFYMDLESDLSKQFLVGAAGRLEDYTDFGSTTTGKITARFAPVEQFAVRGAVATGFRAPSLAQSYFTSTATNFISGVPFDVKTLPVGSAVAKALGAKPLQPEKSVNYSAGIALQPTRNLALTVDYYHITISDRIVLSENFVGTAIRDYLASKGQTTAGGGRFFTNAIDTRTNGVDVVANYGMNLKEAGVLRFTAGFNSSRNKVTAVKQATPQQLGDLSEILFGRVEKARIEVGQPRDNLMLGVTHDWKNLTLVARTQRFGEVTVFQAIATPQAPDQTFSAKWITDLSGTYRFFVRMNLTVGADNLFDVYPDKNSDKGNVATNYSGNSNFGIFPYNGISPFGFNGRFAYAKVGYRF
jgi:iron complex outermembrane receptor protein